VRSNRLLAALVVAGLGCGPGLDDLSLSAPPLGYVRGHVDLSAFAEAAAGKPLRAALVWGAVPNYNMACVKYPEQLAPYCPDPFGFVPGQTEVDVPISDDGSFLLPIHRLPSASVCVGTDAARIAWGSLIVAADTDGSGAFNLLAATPQDDSEPQQLADLALAASFVSLAKPQQRVAFREAGWVAGSLFYPTLGCSAVPPQGFSIFLADRFPGSINCSSVGLDTLIEAAPLTEAEAVGLACRTLNAAPVRMPKDREPGSPSDPGGNPATEICLDPQTLAHIVNRNGPCPIVAVYPLAGCRTDLFCDSPEWDLRDNPPSWWPCGS
jgi:hypothetical protein